MQVKVTIEVDGKKVGEQVNSVAGTLEQMEEKVIAMARSVGQEMLQAALNATADVRPPFRMNSAHSGTKATPRGHSSGSKAR